MNKSLRGPLRYWGMGMTMLMASCSSCMAVGLWDPGLRNGGWRSDFDDPLLGSTARPLVYAETCAYPGIRFALCPTSFRPLPGVTAPPDRFSATNWQDHVTDALGRFWVVGANTEPALHEPCNSGPPNQSEPVGLPNQTVYGLAVEPEGMGVRPARAVLRIALDLRHRPAQLALRPDCEPFDFIPYLGFGAQVDRGAGEPELARIGGQLPEMVWKFSARLESSDAESFSASEGPPAQPKGQHAGVWVEAQWAGHRRWVWIELFNAYDHTEETYFSPWNWAIPESFHFPGAEIVVTSGEALAARCPGFAGALPSTAPDAWMHGDWMSVRIPLDSLFRCVGALYSTDYPGDDSVAVTGMHFWVEVGVRDIDGISGLTSGDYASHLNMAFADVDLVPDGWPVLDDAASLVDVLYADLLHRSPNASERTAALEAATRYGGAALAAQLLDHPESVHSSGVAARLQLIGWGRADDFEQFRRHARGLSESALARHYADQVARDPRFRDRWGSVMDAATVLAMFRDACPLEDEAAQHAQERLALAWSGRVARGLATAGDLLWAVVQHSFDRPRADVRVVQAYAGLAKRMPTSAELSFHLGSEARSAALVEDLYWSPAFRQRFLPDLSDAGPAAQAPSGESWSNGVSSGQVPAPMDATSASDSPGPASVDASTQSFR